MTFDVLGDLYEEYFGKVYNHIYFSVLSKEISEDLTSCVFLKVVQKLDSFDEEKASFNTWLYTIADNTLIDYYRQRKSEVSLDTVIDKPGEPSRHFDDQSDLMKSEDRRALHKALEILDERTREIISLKYNADMSIRDIANLLGIKESTASTLHTRGLAKLRKVLSKDFFY